jgi:hypothetical protein
MDVSDNASYYIKEKLKIKVAKWGTPNKYFKKTETPMLNFFPNGKSYLQKQLKLKFFFL